MDGNLVTLDEEILLPINLLSLVQLSYRVILLLPCFSIISCSSLLSYQISLRFASLARSTSAAELRSSFCAYFCFVLRYSSTLLFWHFQYSRTFKLFARLVSISTRLVSEMVLQISALFSLTCLQSMNLLLLSCFCAFLRLASLSSRSSRAFSCMSLSSLCLFSLSCAFFCLPAWISSCTCMWNSYLCWLRKARFSFFSSSIWRAESLPFNISLQSLIFFNCRSAVEEFSSGISIDWCVFLRLMERLCDRVGVGLRAKSRSLSEACLAIFISSCINNINVMIQPHFLLICSLTQFSLSQLCEYGLG